MAPLFFTLLAERSLSRRREKLKEAREAIGRLGQMGDEVGHSIFGIATTVALNADTLEEGSIAKADVFGEHLLSSNDGISIPEEPFDPATSNPFAAYLHQLADVLNSPSVVDTKAELSYGSTYGKFPDYDICAEELNDLANGSADAGRALETGFARLSDIPGELKGKDAGEERAAIRRPETDGIGPPVDFRLSLGVRAYAIEHTQIEAIPGLIRAGEGYKQLIEPVIKEDRARTVLMLESDDIALTNHVLVGECLAAVLPERTDLPDEIYLVETEVKTWTVRCMKLDTECWPVEHLAELAMFHVDDLIDLSEATTTWQVQRGQPNESSQAQSAI